MQKFKVFYVSSGLMDLFLKEIDNGDIFVIEMSTSV